MLNLPAVARALNILFFDHPPEMALAIWPGDPLHAAAMRAALMPSLYEFINPREEASHYRRETERCLLYTSVLVVVLVVVLVARPSLDRPV